MNKEKLINEIITLLEGNSVLVDEETTNLLAIEEGSLLTNDGIHNGSTIVPYSSLEVNDLDIIIDYLLDI